VISPEDEPDWFSAAHVGDPEDKPSSSSNFSPSLVTSSIRRASASSLDSLRPLSRLHPTKFHAQEDGASDNENEPPQSLDCHKSFSGDEDENQSDDGSSDVCNTQLTEVSQVSLRGRLVGHTANGPECIESHKQLKDEANISINGEISEARSAALLVKELGSEINPSSGKFYGVESGILPHFYYKEYICIAF
jgi:hypothetical protein